MEWAYRMAVEKHLDSTAREVLLAIAYHARATSGRCWASADILADELHCDERTIRRAFVRIEQFGILEPIRRPGQTILWITPAEARWTPDTGDRDPGHSYVRAPRTQLCPTNKGVTSIEQAASPRGHPPGTSKPVSFAAGSGRLPNWSAGEA